MAHYLVTGGAGFIGSHLVEALLKQGDQVRVLDNFATGHRANLQPFMAGIELHEADLRDYTAVEQAVKGVDYILHQGALPSVPRSVRDPLTSHAVNATGTLNLLYAAQAHGVKRLVYASSSSVYGDAQEAVKTEDLTPKPKSPYAVSKLTGEYYCRVFNDLYGVETVMLRYFNVFGPRQDPHSAYAAVIPKFLSAMLKGEAPQVHGDGEQTRDFTYVANNVAANLLACQAPQAAGKVVNVACGTSFSLNQMVDSLNHILGTDIQPQHTDPRAGDVRHSKAGITEAERWLGYTPVVGFEDGLRQLVDATRAGA